MTTGTLRNHLVIVMIGCVALVAGATHIYAATVTIAWDPPDPATDVAGYVVYWGTSSGVYGAQMDAGNSTTADIEDLDPSRTWYFAITAYSATGLESSHSAELVWDNTPPSITGQTAIVLSSDPSGNAELPDLTTQVQTSDNFTAAANMAVGQTPVAGTILNTGTTTVVLTATDEAGNSNTLAVDVVVNPLPYPNAPTSLRVVPS